MRKEWLEKDYYATLEVAKDASQDEIKKAFRRLARDNHPDSHPDDAAAEARFKEANEAYETLRDPETRKEYDHAREMGYFVGGPGGAQQRVNAEDLFGGFRGGGGGGTFFSGLEDLFGGGQPRPRKGQDVSGSITLSFHEALAGATRRIDVGGEQVTVKIPRGIADGTKVRVRGKGGQGVDGGTRGDLFVEVSVADHPVFERVGKRDLRIELPVSYPEAALGATVAVPTLDGTTKIKIPAGTHSGTTMKVSGKGVETDSGTGDLLVHVMIAVHPDPSPEERQALAALRSAEANWNPRERFGEVS